VSKLRFLAAVPIALALSLALPTPALAHSEIIASSPTEGAVLTELPARFSVTANQDLLDVTGDAEGFALQIIGPNGEHYESDMLEVEGPTLSTPAIVGAPGPYTLAYQVVSADGHPVSGEIHFVWEPPASTPSEAPVPLPAPTATGPAATAPSETPDASPTESAEPVPGPDAAFPSWPIALLAALAAVAVIVTSIIALRRKPPGGDAAGA